MTATPPNATGSGCSRSIAATSQAEPQDLSARPALQDLLPKTWAPRRTMPFLLIDFPVFNPVAVSLGPIVIRWYALAYIVGIVLGWVYARSLIKKERLWGGPAPITLPQLDDFILWVTIGIIVGGRT